MLKLFSKTFFQLGDSHQNSSFSESSVTTSNPVLSTLSVTNYDDTSFRMQLSFQLGVNVNSFFCPSSFFQFKYKSSPLGVNISLILMIVLLQVVISKTSCPIKFCLLPEKQPRLRSKEIKVNVNNYFESLSFFLLPFRENALTA